MAKLMPYISSITRQDKNIGQLVVRPDTGEDAVETEEVTREREGAVGEEVLLFIVRPVTTSSTTRTV